MRELFQAYQIKTEQSFSELWRQCDFSFDANVLLDLYNASRSLRDDFFNILDKIPERRFLTHQAALEYYRNRREVVTNARAALGKILSSVTELPSVFHEDAVDPLKKALDDQAKTISSFLEKDPIEERLNAAFSGKLTAPIADTNQAYAAIDARFAALIPPGFADAARKDDYRKYGDGLIWLQLLARAKDTQRPIIFVSSDSKRDWWEWSTDKKRLGPRPELEQEMMAQTGMRFYLYSFDTFMNHAKKELGVSAARSDAETRAEITRIEAEKVESESDTLNFATSLSSTPISGGLFHPDAYLDRAYWDSMNEGWAADIYQGFWNPARLAPSTAKEAISTLEAAVNRLNPFSREGHQARKGLQVLKANLRRSKSQSLMRHAEQIRAAAADEASEASSSSTVQENAAESRSQENE